MPEIRVKKIPGLTAPYWDLSEYFLSLDGDQTLTPEQVAAIIASLGLGTMATQDEGTGSGDFRDNAANDARFVQLTGDQDVAGVKTFTSGLSIAMAEPQWAMTDTSDGNKAVAIALLGNQFLIAADRNGDGTVESPFPLLLNSDSNTAQLYGSLAYTRANILGTVSQSSGVPTGAIMERGSNANGEYVRYANGRQECQRVLTVDLTSSSLFSGNFPAAFAGRPAVGLGVNNATDLVAGDQTALFNCAVRTSGTGSAWQFQSDGSGVSTSVGIAVTAVGFWF